MQTLVDAVLVRVGSKDGIEPRPNKSLAFHATCAVEVGAKRGFALQVLRAESV